ncbi:hypothetical protein [Trichothermofontia sp.]
MNTPLSQSATLLLTLMLGITGVGSVNLLGVPAAIAQASPVPPPSRSPLPGVRSLDQLLQEIRSSVPLTRYLSTDLRSGAQERAP